MILLYLSEGKSLAGTSALLQLANGAKLTKEAVAKRIRNSAEWLRWMCENIFRRAGLLVKKPEWLKDKNVLLIDGSEVVKHGKKQQSHMLHYSLDLFTLDVRELHVTDSKTGEKLSNFKKFEENDIGTGDRAFGTLTGMAHLRQYGAGYLLRLRSDAFTIYKKEPVWYLFSNSEIKAKVAI